MYTIGKSKVCGRGDYDNGENWEQAKMRNFDMAGDSPQMTTKHQVSTIAWWRIDAHTIKFKRRNFFEGKKDLIFLWTLYHVWTGSCGSYELENITCENVVPLQKRSRLSFNSNIWFLDELWWYWENMLSLQHSTYATCKRIESTHFFI